LNERRRVTRLKKLMSREWPFGQKFNYLAKKNKKT